MSHTELNRLNQELLISQKVGESIDTINLIDIIKGNDLDNYLIDTNGDTINSKTFDQKVILLDFWFLACKPCIVELPGLDLLIKKINSDKFRFRSSKKFSK